MRRRLVQPSQLELRPGNPSRNYKPPESPARWEPIQSLPTSYQPLQARPNIDKQVSYLPVAIPLLVTCWRLLGFLGFFLLCLAAARRQRRRGLPDSVIFGTTRRVERYQAEDMHSHLLLDLSASCLVCGGRGISTLRSVPGSQQLATYSPTA